MEDKKLSPQESMEIISKMIEESKARIAMPNIRISMMWGILTVITAAMFMLLVVTYRNSLFNYIWFAIPVIGLPLHFFMDRNNKKAKATTIIDKIRCKLWKIVGAVAIILTVICITFSLYGYHQVWLIMLYYAFIIVGFGVAVTGIVYKESAYIIGGVFSIIMGFVVVALTLCNVPLLVTWLIPVYILSFLLMFILPAFIIRRKLNKAIR